MLIDSFICFLIPCGDILIKLNDIEGCECLCFLFLRPKPFVTVNVSCLGGLIILIWDKVGHALAAHIIGTKDSLDYSSNKTGAIIALISVLPHRADELVRCGALVYNSVLVIFLAVQLLVKALLYTISLLPEEHLEDLVVDELQHVYDLEFPSPVLADVAAIFHRFFSVGCQLEDFGPQRYAEIVKFLLNVFLIVFQEMLNKFVENVTKY